MVVHQGAASFPTISLVWADGGYAGQADRMAAISWCGWVLEIVRKLGTADRVFNSFANAGLSNARSPGWHIPDDSARTA